MKTHAAVIRRRRGIGWIEVVVLLGILVAVATFFLSQIGSARETARGNKCRSNLRGLATAVFNSTVRAGHYPGYMNALELSDGTLYVDPQTREPTPVSWVVMILPDIDCAPLYDQWCRPTQRAEAKLVQPRVYVDYFLCPSDPPPLRVGTPISFVVNTGLPDAAAAVVKEQDSEQSIPRDWAANGMFFDNYSEHRLVKPDPAKRGPMICMRDEDIADPKSRTILLTENVDATSYVFDPSQSADGWQAAEIQAGSIWRLEAVDDSTKPPSMKPPVPSLGLNVDMEKGDGKSFDYSRPSSRHPQSVNVAFVEVNVAPLRDVISYYVYAKLMATDDKNVALPGSLPPDRNADPYRGFRRYQLTEEDFNP
jgi:hypothetical protein